MGEQVWSGGVIASTEYLVPVMPIGTADVAPGSMVDYFGITHQGLAGTFNVQVLPFRAVNLIWNEWFRDQDLQEPLVVNTDDGPDTNIYVLPNRGKRHDYFTTCRPWPQKPAALTGFGSSSQNPFGPGLGMSFPTGAAPVSGFGVLPSNTPTAADQEVWVSGGRNVVFPGTFSTDVDTFVIEAGQTLAGADTQYPNVRVLINDIRTANMVQLLMERNARGGTRYTEIIRSQFGVVSPDARLQRPEYLGGGRAFVNVNPVAQTSATGADGTTTVLGELAGIGTAVVQNHGFSHSFTEHGMIIGFVSVRADLTYQQGVNRMWFRRSRYDFYTPALAHLGEQAVISREIYADASGNNTGQLSTATGDYSVFGYNERWSEYKYKPSRVSGWFRSSTATPLDYWHLALNFGSRPVLNDTFIEDDPPVGRVLQVYNDEDATEFLIDALFEERNVRCMPMYSLPGLGGRL